MIPPPADNLLFNKLCVINLPINPVPLILREDEMSMKDPYFDPSLPFEPPRSDEDDLADRMETRERSRSWALSEELGPLIPLDGDKVVTLADEVAYVWGMNEGLARPFPVEDGKTTDETPFSSAA